MDLLIEKGDSRTYLSQLKVLVTKFEEGAPAITRNSTQIQGRNGNVDFGGWHTSKEIEVEGFYRADDLDEETTLRERLYALLSDTDGFYITEMRGELTPDFERPGENEGNLYEQLTTRPSHKRFFVYAKSIEPELQGNIDGAVLYKLTMTFITMKLPYGESVPRNLDVKPNVPYYGENLLKGTSESFEIKESNNNYNFEKIYDKLFPGKKYSFSSIISQHGSNVSGSITIAVFDQSINIKYFQTNIIANNSMTKVSFEIPTDIKDDTAILILYPDIVGKTSGKSATFNSMKLEEGNPTPWSPSPSDTEYNAWHTKIYYNTDNLVIPYAGTVPCSQLEQGFIVEFTAKQSGGNLVLTLNGTEFRYNGQIYSDDVLTLTGYEYTKNSMSIVKNTNKAYFKLLPGVTNKVSSSLAGEIRILNFQNLYA